MAERKEALNVLGFLKQHRNKVIIFGHGGADPFLKKGYYHFGLVYNMCLKTVKDENIESGSANRCILMGAVAAATLIKKPTDVILLTALPLGFQKAQKNKGPNHDLCNDFTGMLELEKGCTLQIVEEPNTAGVIKYLLQNADKYFKVLPSDQKPKDIEMTQVAFNLLPDPIRKK